MLDQKKHLGTLEAAIQIKHKCTPVHRETIFVHERTESQETVWKGHVDVFELIGHEGAKTCYAWWHIESDREVKILTVLGNRLIDTANKAVQAAIFMDEQPVTFPRPTIVKISGSDMEEIVVNNRMMLE